MDFLDADRKQLQSGRLEHSVIIHYPLFISVFSYLYLYFLNLELLTCKPATCSNKQDRV